MSVTLRANHNLQYPISYSSRLIPRLTCRTVGGVRVLLAGAETFWNEPDLQKIIIELIKYCGLIIFKTFQKDVAAGCLFIVSNCGLYLDPGVREI